MDNTNWWFIGFPHPAGDKTEDETTREKAAAKARRVVVLRGSRWAEVSGPPTMETR